MAESVQHHAPPHKHHTKGHVRAIFQRQDFRRLLGTRAASQIADGFFQASLAVIGFFSPSSNIEPAAYAIAFTMLIGPYSLLGPYVGVFLDRWSRRNILAVSNFLRALLVIPAAIVLYTDGPILIAGVFAMLVITINRFVLAGLSAAQPHVVEGPHLVTANAFATTMGTICFGAGLGGALLVSGFLDSQTHGYGFTAALAAPLYAVSAFIAWRSFRQADLGPDETERHTGKILAAIAEVSRGMITGFRHVWQRRGSAYVIGVQAAHRALYGVMFVATLAVFREYYHDPVAYPNYEDTLAWLGACAAAGQLGSFLSALITPNRSRRYGPGTWVTMLLLMMVVLATTIGFTMIEVAFVVATFLLNITSQGIKIVVDTSIQSNCDDEYRGRLFSLNDTVYNVSFIFGMFTAAMVIPTNGYAPWLLFSAAGGYLLLTGCYRIGSNRYAPYGRLK